MNRPAVIDRATLPTTVEPLQDMVLEMAAQLDGLRAQFDAQMQNLCHQLAELRRRLFGPRSEAMHPGQGELWSEAVEVPVPPQEYREVEAHRRRQPGRAAIGDHLPRRRVEHDLSEDEKAAFAAVERIGEEVSEMLEYIPARLEVIQNVRLKYRCERADGSSTIRTAIAQNSPIAKSNAGPGLLAHVMVSKYLDHCPLARQQRILARDGVVTRLLQWAADEGLQMALSQPGKPWQNGTDESFNGKFRDECLSMEYFRNRTEARVVIEQWRRHYNEVRPHSALGYLTPAQYVQNPSGNDHEAILPK